MARLIGGNSWGLFVVIFLGNKTASYLFLTCYSNKQNSFFSSHPPTGVENQCTVGILLVMLHWIELARLCENWHIFLYTRKYTFPFCCVSGSLFKVTEIQAKLCLTENSLKGGRCGKIKLCSQEVRWLYHHSQENKLCTSRNEWFS